MKELLTLCSATTRKEHCNNEEETLLFALSQLQWLANVRQYCYKHIACFVHTKMSCL